MWLVVDVQACCQNSTSFCCTGVAAPSDMTENVTCPCKSCWDRVAVYVDHAVKAAGGIGLLFSFTEVMPSIYLLITSRFPGCCRYCYSCKFFAAKLDKIAVHFLSRKRKTFVSPEMVYLCPVSLWQFKSWLLDSRVIHKGRVDHRGWLPIIWPLTGDVYRMSVCPEGSAWWQTVAGRRKHILV